MTNDPKFHNQEEPTTSCSKCEDTGIENSSPVYSELHGLIPAFCNCPFGMQRRQEWYESDEGIAARREHAELRMKQLHNRAYLPGRFENASIAMLPGTFRNVAEEYVAKWPEALSLGKGFFLWGSVGAGKTYAAVAIAREIMLQHLAEVSFFGFTQLMNEVREGFDSEEDDGTKMLRRARTCSLLVIDDLSMTRPTEWAIEQLYGIVNTRYEAKLPMIVTSNLGIEDTGKIYNPQTASRLLETCRLVQFAGEDRRSTNR